MRTKYPKNGIAS